MLTDLRLSSERALAFARRDGPLLFGTVLSIHLLFSLLIANSYDPDEFVILTLSRMLAHGAVPYHNFTFFHPPGVLVLYALLQPLVGAWWPVARLVMVLANTLTALIVWRIAACYLGRREALAAGLLYGISPIALLCGVRVGQDTPITLLGMAGVLALLAMPARRGAVLAGICLAAAIWFKYPAILFAPVYLAVRPRRFPLAAAAAAVTLGVLFAPLLPYWHAVYQDSVVWQTVARTHASLPVRIGSTLAFWWLLNPLAVYAFPRWRGPRWVQLGFLAGAGFAISGQVYYHYFVPIEPFAALLAAPVAVRLLQRAPRRTVTIVVILLAAWAGALNVGPSRFGLGAMDLSQSAAAAGVLRKVDRLNQPVLSAGFEYPYLAGRKPDTSYFWDLQFVVKPRALEQRLQRDGAVVLAEGIGEDYPAAFLRYLHRHHFRVLRLKHVTLVLPGTPAQYRVRTMAHARPFVIKPYAPPKFVDGGGWDGTLGGLLPVTR